MKWELYFVIRGTPWGTVNSKKCGWCWLWIVNHGFVNDHIHTYS